MALCKCEADQREGACPVHPVSLTCELCHRAPAENWSIEKQYDRDTGIGYYEAVPVCHDCTTKVGLGDRPDDVVAVAHGMGLIGAYHGP